MHLRQLGDVFEDVVAYRNARVNHTGTDLPRRVRGSHVTEAYFRVFRGPYELGRPFTVREDTPGAARTAVISHAFWAAELGGDPDVLGRAILLNGSPHTVVGVTAPGFDTRDLGDIDVWVPLQLDRATTDQGQYFRLVARLAPGVSLQQAEARLPASTTAYRERFPNALPPELVFGARRSTGSIRALPSRTC